MNREMRQRQRIAQEGQLLQAAAQHGVDIGIALAEANADGSAHALRRLQGPAKAAETFYRIADRLATGVRPDEIETGPPAPKPEPAPPPGPIGRATGTLLDVYRDCLPMLPGATFLLGWWLGRLS